MRAVYNPVRYAFRTAGLVRGPSPYALIADDLRKDDSEHLYEWQLQVPPDLDVCSAWKQDPRCIILARREDIAHERFNTPEKGKPCLLLYILEATAEPQAAQFDVTVPTPRLDSFGQGHARLVLSSRSVTPKFKVLLLPWRWQTDAPTLPEVTFADGVATLTVMGIEPGTRQLKPIQQDMLRFTEGQEHRSRITIEGDGTQLVDID